MLKAAVIGCGRIAHGFDDDPKRTGISTHTGAYQNIECVELVAICDIDEKLANEVANKRNIKRAYSSYLEMLGEEKVDIVSVCTPPHTHFEIVTEIARCQLAKAIFCEKPIAETISQADGMVESCRHKNIILQINHQRRFDPMHQDIRSKIQSGIWGKVQRANFYYSAGVRNTGSHMFDLLRFMFGDAKWVQAHLSANPSGQHQDPNIDGFIQFKDGPLASFQALDHTKFLIFELDIYFEKSRLTITKSGLGVDFWTVGGGNYVSGYKELIKSTPPFNTEYQRNEMVEAVREIVNCLKNYKESISSGKDGLATLKIIEAAFKSTANNNKKVYL